MAPVSLTRSAFFPLKNTFILRVFGAKSTKFSVSALSTSFDERTMFFDGRALELLGFLKLLELHFSIIDIL